MAYRIQPRARTVPAAPTPGREAWRRRGRIPSPPAPAPAEAGPAAPDASIHLDLGLRRPPVTAAKRRPSGALLMSLLGHVALGLALYLSPATPGDAQGEAAVEVTFVEEPAPIGDAAADARAAPDVEVAAPPDATRLTETPPEIPLPEIEVAMPEPVPAVEFPPEPVAETPPPEFEVPTPEPVPPVEFPPEPVAETPPEVEVPAPAPVPPVEFPPEPVAETPPEVEVPAPAPVPPVAFPPVAETPPPAPEPKPAPPKVEPPKPAPPAKAEAAKPARKPPPKRVAAEKPRAVAQPATGENNATRQAGQAASGGAGGRTAASAAGWRSRVQAAILRNKPAPDDERQGLVQVAFSVGRDGGISGLRLAASSGSPQLDAAALAAVRRAAPFPPVPDDMAAPVALAVPIRFRID